MKIKFNSDEWYPVYMPTDSTIPDFEIEMTEQEITDFWNSKKQFQKWQDIIRSRKPK